VLTAGIFTETGDREVLYLEETPQGTITLTQIREEAGFWKSLEVDGVNVAGTSPGLVAIQKLQGHLPLLLHPAPEAVLHIGFGSGGTARAVSTHPDVQRIDIVEINPAVLRTSALHLPEVNEGVLEDPRVRVIIDDGRNFLLATDRAYDVILSDAVHPRYAGNSALYTTDYFREARRRLRPGGLMSMWLPIYGLSPDSYKMILASMRAVFPDTSLWYVNSTINEFCIVVGRTAGPEIDLDRMGRALAQPTVRQDLLPVGAADPVRVMDYLVAQGSDLDAVLEGTPLSRDDRPLVEYLSARSLDRTLTWMQNFQIITKVRTPRWDLLTEASRSPERMRKLSALYSSTGWNLAGQAMLLVAGHEQVPPPKREQARRHAAEAFGMADTLAPDEREPWEWFGVPQAYPGEWNR
jgi:spermidine synthase